MRVSIKLYTGNYTALPYGVKNTSDADKGGTACEPSGTSNNQYKGLIYPN